MLNRAILIVLDSVGVGNAPDAAAYGDEGANTVGHIAEWAAIGKADRQGLRSGPLFVPNMDALGRGAAIRLASGKTPPPRQAPRRAACTACLSGERLEGNACMTAGCS